MAIGQDLLNVPMGDMIRQMAFAIADAQFELDESSMHVAEMMSGRRVLRDAEGNPLDKTGQPIVLPASSPMSLLGMEDTRVFFGSDLVEIEVPVPTDPTKTKKITVRQPALVSMLELGFTPVFYQFIETIIEVKIAIKMTQETSFTQTTKTSGNAVSLGLRRRRGLLSGRAGIEVSTTQVDATYSSKYTYSAEGSSLLRTKMVPVPPPAILEERIRFLLDQDKREREEELSKE